MIETKAEFAREIELLRAPVASPVPQPFELVMHALRLGQAAALEGVQARRAEEDRLLRPARRE